MVRWSCPAGRLARIRRQSGRHAGAYVKEDKDSSHGQCVAGPVSACMARRGWGTLGVARIASMAGAPSKGSACRRSPASTMSRSPRSVPATRRSRSPAQAQRCRVFVLQHRFTCCPGRLDDAAKACMRSPRVWCCRLPCSHLTESLHAASPEKLCVLCAWSGRGGGPRLSTTAPGRSWPPARTGGPPGGDSAGRARTVGQPGVRGVVLRLALGQRAGRRLERALARAQQPECAAPDHAHRARAVGRHYRVEQHLRARPALCLTGPPAQGLPAGSLRLVWLQGCCQVPLRFSLLSGT